MFQHWRVSGACARFAPQCWMFGAVSFVCVCKFIPRNLSLSLSFSIEIHILHHNNSMYTLHRCHCCCCCISVFRSVSFSTLSKEEENVWDAICIVDMKPWHRLRHRHRMWSWKNCCIYYASAGIVVRTVRCSSNGPKNTMMNKFQACMELYQWNVDVHNYTCSGCCLCNETHTHTHNFSFLTMTHTQTTHPLAHTCDITWRRYCVTQQLAWPIFDV